MFNLKIVCNVLFCIVFGAAIAFVLFLLADIYQNEDSRENMMFLCTFIVCVATVISIFLSVENNIERKKLIKAIEKAIDEIQNLRNTIAKLGKTNAIQR